MAFLAAVVVLRVDHKNVPSSTSLSHFAVDSMLSEKARTRVAESMLPVALNQSTLVVAGPTRDHWLLVVETEFASFIASLKKTPILVKLLDLWCY